MDGIVFYDDWCGLDCKGLEKDKGYGCFLIFEFDYTLSVDKENNQVIRCKECQEKYPSKKEY